MMQLAGWITGSLVFLVSALWVIRRYSYRRYGDDNQAKRQKQPSKLWSWIELEQLISHTFQAWTNDPILDQFIHEESYRREYAKRSALRAALRTCGSGDRAQKQLVKSFITDILKQHVEWTMEQWNCLIPFDQPALLSVKDKFDILLYTNVKKYKAEAIEHLVSKYAWDEPRYVITKYGEEEAHYMIESEHIEAAYRQECSNVKAEDRIQIIVQRIYEQFKGLSVIDELRDQRIDGISGGVSGINGSTAWEGWDDHKESTSRLYAHDSVWMFYHGKSIRLAFLGFNSEAELKRVCHNIYKHNAPGPLTEADGFRVNDMKDGSRVVVMRPPFAESWAFFVRKFNREQPTLEHLLQNDGAEQIITLLRYLMKGARITAITGAQGSGKTTLLMALVQAIYPFYSLRVQEQAFELHLRRLYPERNILTLRETEYITGQAGLDVQKKTDGSVHILGEIATDPVAAWMLQMAQVASLFTLFTHHAKTFPDLMLSLRNSLLKVGMFNEERIAEQQVAHVIQFNIHLNRDVFGHRYIERITECIPVQILREGRSPIGADNLSQPQDWTSYVSSATRYYEQETNPQAFEYRNIMEYSNGKYVWVNPISEQQVSAMKLCMSDRDQNRFQMWIEGKGSYAA